MYAKYIRNFSSWEQAKQSVPMGGKHGGKGKASYGQRPQQRVTDWIEYDLLKDVFIRKFSGPGVATWSMESLNGFV